MFLLDTNVVSELRKAPSGRADANVVAWAGACDPVAFHLSAITVMELELGVARKERIDPRAGATLRAWLDGKVLTEFARRVLPVDAIVAIRCARLHVPDPRPERDALIAATALVHGLTVVTRNLADFASTGVACHDPWRTVP